VSDGADGRRTAIASSFDSAAVPRTLLRRCNKEISGQIDAVH